MTIIEKTDNKLTIPVGIGVVQTETTRNFYNTSDATATANDILVDKTAYGKYGKLTGTLDLIAEKEISYNDGYKVGNTEGYDSGYDIGYGNGYTEGETNGYNNGYNIGVADGVVEGKNEIIEGQSDATITPQNVLRGYVGYGKDNERIVGESDAITTIDVGASGIKFGYSSFSEIPSYYNFDNVTNMSYMFQNCSNLTTIPQLNTSNATDMSNMFYSCSNIKTVPEFDTSNVTNMDNMFYYCSNLTSVPEFDTSNVTNMDNMFIYCSKLTSVPEFDTSSVTNMNSMFYGCSKLVSVPELNCQSINSYLPTSIYDSIFYNCASLSEFGGFKDLGKGFTGSNKKSFFMGYNLKALTKDKVITIFNKLYDMNLNTAYTGIPTLYLSKYPYDILTEEDIAIATNKGWTVGR